MAASKTDAYKKSGSATVTTLAAPGKALSATSITVGSTTNFPTDTGIVIGIRQVDTSGKLVAGTYTEWRAIVSSGTTFSIESTPVLGSDQVYPASSTTQVLLPVSSSAHNELVAGLLSAGLTQAGGMGAITPTSVTSPVGVFTTLTVGSQTPSADWTASIAPTTVTYNGNHSYDLVYNSTDLTGAINPGTRIRTTRTVAAPTQSTSLSGTQYWVKTSPNKLTFTDDFVVSVSIKPTSYTTGVIVSRFNGTSGFGLAMESDGRISLTIYNAGGANFSQVKSYQSVALNKWTHVAVQMDASAFTATNTTSYVMLDGADVPAVVTRGGTNPTALVQAGNLEIGSQNGGTSPFAGKIAQVAVFNAKVTQATMRGYISQGLSGTETSLASAYSFNGVTTDLNTTTPNDLVAGAGSPTATNADSPFGTQASGLISSTLDYGIVQAAAFSSNTTLTIQVPEGCTIPTSGGVSAVSYSGVKAPYGFPAQVGKWQIASVYNLSLNQNTPTVNTPYNLGSAQINVPVGSYNIKYKGSLYIDANTAVVGESHISSSAASNTPLSSKLSSVSYHTSGGLISAHMGEDNISVSVQTTLYVNSKFNGSAVTMQWYSAVFSQNNYGGLYITADNAYL